jgi:hypothetical protein
VTKKNGKWLLLIPAIFCLFVSCGANNSVLNSESNSKIEQSFESDVGSQESGNDESDESDKQDVESSGSEAESDKNSTESDSETSDTDEWIDINFPRP